MLKVTTSLIAFSLSYLPVVADDGLVAEESWKIFTPGVAPVEAEIPAEAPIEPKTAINYTPPAGVEVIDTQDDSTPPVQILDATSPEQPAAPMQVMPMPEKRKHKSLSRKTMKKGRYGLFATGEWLYWTVHEGGIDYAVKQAIDPNIFSGLPGAHAKKISFDWESGYRVGVGSHFGPDLWDISVAYTHFHTDSSNSTHGDGINDAIFPLLYYQGDNPISLVTDAHAHTSIHLSVLDLELGREYFLTRRLSLRPHVGVKGANIWQNFHVTYSNSLDDSEILIPGEVVNIKIRNRFKGVGPRVGLNTTWYFGKGVNLFANTTAALLYGIFNLKQTQLSVNQEVPPSPLEQIDLSSSLHQFSPTLQIIMGLAWDKKFCNDAYHIGIGAGYEIQYWWRQNQFERFTAATVPTYVRNSEDLVFHGLTASLRFDF